MIKESLAEYYILGKWANAYNFVHNYVYFHYSPYMSFSVLEFDEHRGQSFLEFNCRQLSFRDFHEVCELVKCKKSIWIIFDCHTFANCVPWFLVCIIP
jgi:hypothetical protein